MSQPLGFCDTNFPSHVCKLIKSNIWSKTSPSAWYNTLSGFLSSLGFHSTKSDESLFVYQLNGVAAYFLVYVDDFIFTCNDSDFLSHVVTALSMHLSMKNLASLSYFLGIDVLRTESTCFLSQRKYITDLLALHNMLSANPVQTPLATCSSLTFHDGTAPADATVYPQVLGSL